MYKEIEIKLSHLKIRAIEYGSPTGAPVIGLHGWLDNAATFSHLAPFLKNSRLIALDLVGHGLSDWRPAGTHYHIIDYVTDLFDIADALGLKQFGLIGHSLGAAIASLAAGLMPDRINRLALIDGLGPFTTQANDISEHYQKAHVKYLQLPRKKLPSYEKFEDALKARAHSGQMDPLSAKPIVERGLVQLDKGYSWRTDPRLTNPSFLQFSEEQTLGILAKIKAPTCVIIALQGLLPNFPSAKTRMEQIKNLEKHKINAGHHLHLDHPEKIADILNTFFLDRQE